MSKTIRTFSVLILLTFLAGCASVPVSSTAPRSPALLVLDLQADFLGPAPKMPVTPTQVPGILSKSATLVAAFRAAGRPVVFIRNEFPLSDGIVNWFRHDAALAGSDGARWVGPSGEPDLWVDKKVADAFSEPSLSAFLTSQKIDGVVVIGVFGEGFNCVPSTSSGARKGGWTVTIASDALGTGDPGALEGALHDLEAAGARVRTSEQIVADLSAPALLAL